MGRAAQPSVASSGEELGNMLGVRSVRHRVATRALQNSLSTK